MSSADAGRPPVTEFFHLAYFPEDRWVRPILARLRTSPSATLQRRVEEWASSPLSGLGLALVTKLELLRVTRDRFNTDITELSDEFDRRREEVEQHTARRAAVVLDNNALAFRLVADADAFIFEARSAYEIVGRFVREFFSRILGRVVDEETLKQALRGHGCDVTWIELLRSERILFFHRAAPWLAIEVTEASPRYHLVVLRRNTHDLSNPEDYVRFEEYGAILEGFDAAMGALYSWIMQEISAYERNEARRPS